MGTTTHLDDLRTVAPRFLKLGANSISRAFAALWNLDQENGMQSKELSVLREQIDAIDEELVKLLARRFQVTNAVGQLKAKESLCAVDPVREAQQEQRLVQFAATYGVNQALVSRIFRTIVEEVVSTHEIAARALKASSS